MSEGIDRAIDRIAELAVEAAGVSVVDLPGLRQYLIRSRSAVERHDTPPPYRAHTVDDLGSLVQLAKAAAQEAGLAPAIWYNHAEVVLTYDVADRRDTARMELVLSRQWLFLRRLEERDLSGVPLRTFLASLRLELDAPKDLVARFRKLDWHQQQKAATVLGHGRESLGRSIETALSAVDELPEELTVSVPVWSNEKLRQAWPVRLLLEINAEDQTFAMRPRPGELAGVADEAEAFLRAELAELLKAEGLIDAVPVYHGAP